MDEVIANWSNTFNATALAFGSLDEARAAAVTADYSFLSWNGSVHDVRFGLSIDLRVDSNRLWYGVKVLSDNTYVTAAPVTPSMWVVLPINYEYDDSNYHQIGLGDPVRCFDTKEAAEAEAKRLELGYVLDGNDPFETRDENDTFDYEDLVSMPWPMWADWLRDNGVPLPGWDDEETDVELTEPTLDTLKSWWDGSWAPDVKRRAAAHLILNEYVVEECPFGPQ